MAHVLKYGAAATDEGALEFTTLKLAVKYWEDNLLGWHNSQNVQEDDVEFLQVGDASLPDNVGLSKAIDSRGYSFTITNPDGYQNTAGQSTNGSGILLSQYKARNITLNRIHLGSMSYSYSSGISPLGSVELTTYHATDDEATINIYNCVLASYSGTGNGINFPGNAANLRICNCIILPTGGNTAPYITLPNNRVSGVFENNIFHAYRITMPTSTPLVRFRNNIVLSNIRAETRDVIQSVGSLPQNVKDELPFNVYNFDFADAEVSGSIDATRKSVDPTEIFKQHWYGGYRSIPAPTSTWIALNSMVDMKMIIRDYTPRRTTMAAIAPPVSGRVNPLRYFINGWDAQNGEQYGACGYDWQESFEFAPPMLTVTPLPTLEMRLDWTVPPDLPPQYTKWGIYKKSPPPPANLYNFLGSPAPTRIGEVARNVNTFTDNGSVLTSVLGTELSYRIRPER